MWLGITFYTLMTLFIIVALFLILLVLIQKGRGGGLASAFGGMGGNTAFGSKTGDVLTWATSVVFGLFLLLAILLNYTAAARHNRLTQLPAASATIGAGAGAGAESAGPETAVESPLVPTGAPSPALPQTPPGNTSPAGSAAPSPATPPANTGTPANNAGTPAQQPANPK